ncbi:hypothetical protein [Brachyspira hampsonii]|uniref:Heat-shock protein n=1 Tax=Brachyspira hampsonii TaxID=1287055 RepID=A0AAC9TW74_9SPIR|nr:hypothetical protein [Brachyspira hampsonii]ASJ22037.1 hypothetical protein BHAMNSH16_10500 [Brachyspira hampsonii]ELV05549.1 hypothetical protein H263_09613 [Brachyspira hampsonii 30599]MBW5380939.1 hypothetical protein [Brachyspira hampsonii]OEJ17728.1 hypothetical protein A9496_10230 [Brachyspira hampsonii]
MKGRILKFSFFLLISSFLLINISCSKKTEENTNIPEDLYGQYFMSADETYMKSVYVIVGYDGLEIDYPNDESTIEVVKKCADVILESDRAVKGAIGNDDLSKVSDNHYKTISTNDAHMEFKFNNGVLEMSVYEGTQKLKSINLPKLGKKY